MTMELLARIRREGVVVDPDGVRHTLDEHGRAQKGRPGHARPDWYQPF